MKTEKRIPTILGLILILASVAVGVYLTNFRTSLGSRASGTCQPQSIQLTNVTNAEAVVSFFTSASCLSTLQLSSRTINKLNLPNQATKLHYFLINSLKPSTEYQFNLVLDGRNIESKEYRFLTSQTPSSDIPKSNLAWGKVLNPDGKPAKKAILFLDIPGAAPLSALVTDSGYWNISLASSFNQAKNNWFPSPPNTSEDIVVVSEEGLTSQITSNTDKNNPVPDIILGQNKFSSSDPYANSSSASFPTTTQSPSSIKKLEIQNPTEGESLNSPRPDFFGQAPSKNSTINIKVESPVVINGQATVGNDGTWHWSPPQDLTPGEHTITVTATNPTTGLSETVKKRFIVYAADNSLSFSASASANITPTVFPTVAPTLTAFIPSPTAIPTSVRSSRPSTTSAVPVTGYPLPTFAVIISSLLFIALSSLLFIKK